MKTEVLLLRWVWVEVDELALTAAHGEKAVACGPMSEIITDRNRLGLLAPADRALRDELEPDP
jgi:hypothetical protein